MACHFPVRSLYCRSENKLFYGKRPPPGKSVPPGMELVDVPCGQCAGCRLEYSRQWAIRCQLESTLYPPGTCWMLTLTYDDEHLPASLVPVVDGDTGEVLDQVVTHSLDKSVPSTFIRRLRRYWREQLPDHHTGIRFFATGEYGDRGQRPHYHFVLFNLPFPAGDLELLKEKDGFTYWLSSIIGDLWPCGFHILTECTFDSAAYVARYMLKKHKGKDADWYEKRGLVPVFSCASNHPGIARQFYEDNKFKIYSSDGLAVLGSHGATWCRPPKSFDRLFGLEDPGWMSVIKECRQMNAKEVQRRKLDRWHLSDDVESYTHQIGKEEERKFLASQKKRQF